MGRLARFPNAFDCCVLNYDLFDFFDSDDKSADHKELETENRFLRTQHFCGTLSL